VFSAEPQRTQFDLNFKLFGIPVRVHPFFWLVALITGAGSAGGAFAPVFILIWVAVLFFSILVHEFGHALTMRYFGSDARVVLYMMGGLAIAEQSPFGNEFYNRTRQPRNAILIDFAGPAAGFGLAAIVVAVVFVAGYKFEPDRLYGYIPFFDVVGVANGYLYFLIRSMLFVNIFWGLVNLLPVYPLDGGQISRELFLLKDPWNGMVRSLWLSVIVGAFIAVLAVALLRQDGIFFALMFGSLAFMSWQILQSFTGRGGGGGYGGPW
jgi:stage IV sporulation protein FB